MRRGGVSLNEANTLQAARHSDITVSHLEPKLGNQEIGKDNGVSRAPVGFILKSRTADRSDIGVVPGTNRGDF
jgi:hypothetical protein